MLMMVDPDVHFHVIPRYSSPREASGLVYADAGWPGPPALEPAIVPGPEQSEVLRVRLAQAWPKPDNTAA